MKKFSTRLLIFSLSCALILFCGSCQAKKEPRFVNDLPNSPKENQSKPVEQAFRMNLHSEPSSLDPRFVRDIPTTTTGKMFFDGLTRMNFDGQAWLSIAKDMAISEDQKTYTFHLKETVWSNGNPVTAYDFENAWKKILSPDFPAEYAHQLFIIKNAEQAKLGRIEENQIGISCPDDYTLIVELEHPYPYFLDLLASPICFPISSLEEKKHPDWASKQGEEFVCNGPFRLKKWNHGNELVAEKNPLYWEKEVVRLNSIILTMIEDEHTELNMYENGELDWAGSPNSSIPPEALPSLKINLVPEDELYILPIAGTYCYKFNTKMPPFDSIKMRKAFAYAINRRSLIDNILQANQLVATALLPPCMTREVREKLKLEESSAYFKDGDYEQAKKLFEEALTEKGLSRESLPPITLIYSKSEKHQKIAQAVQQEWSNSFDIKINLQSYEWNTYIDHLSKHNYQVGGRGWISDIRDPKTLLEIYKFSNNEGGGNNDTQWENPEFIRLVDLAASSKDPQQREQLLLQAEGILIDEMPITPLFHSTACYLKKSYVKKVYMSELCDLDFKSAYIER